MFVLLTLGYAVKLVTAPAAVVAEFRHRSPATCSAVTALRFAAAEPEPVTEAIAWALIN